MMHRGRLFVATLAWLSFAAPGWAQPGNRPPAAPGSGEALFQTSCGFCHGRDATGGATGPDLTDSVLVGQDKDGDKMGPVIKSGRPEKGMPPFASFSAADLKKIVDYIHARKADIDKNPGRRRKVTAEDLSTGNVEKGRAYFEGAGGCRACHSPTGDLAGVGAKYRGLALMQRFLNPTAGNANRAPGEPAKPNSAVATVTLPSGETVSGPVASVDEFTIALRDANGWYRSWPRSQVKVAIKDPIQAHVDLLPKYTDDDIHNLFAYLQTLVK